MAALFKVFPCSAAEVVHCSEQGARVDASNPRKFDTMEGGETLGQKVW